MARKERKRKNRYRGTRIELLIIFAACMFRLGWEYRITLDYQRQQEELRAAAEAQERTDENDMAEGASGGEDGDAPEEEPEHSEETGETDTETEPEEPVMLDNYVKLHTENEDMVGWLTIPGTEIDYPVMQNADNEYYLHHDFYGEDDRHGCLFVKDIADVDTPGDCFIIYGHNMKDGTMFGDLDEYRSEDYYKEHSVLKFSSLYEEREYEIMSVFLSHVYKEGEEGFRYYEFYTADTEEAFKEFYDNVMENALYDTGVSAAYGDTFLMLSTCAYHEEDGRLVVVAKRKREGQAGVGQRSGRQEACREDGCL